MVASCFFAFPLSLPTAKEWVWNVVNVQKCFFFVSWKPSCSMFNFLFLLFSFSCQGASSKAAIVDFIDFLSACPTACFGALLKLSSLFAVSWSCLNDDFFFLPVAWAFQNILCGVLMLKLKDADGSCAFLHILSWNDAFEETFWASWRLFFLFVCWVLSLPRLYWLRFFFRPSCMHHWEFGSFCFLLSICRHHHSLSFQLCAAEKCVQTWMIGSE